MKGALLVCVLIGLLAACGGKSEVANEREAAAKSGRGTVTCAGRALRRGARLPAEFPKEEGITFVKTEQRGPTRVVDGYSVRSIDDLYDNYLLGLDAGGHAVLFDEIEKSDAEISYRLSGQTEGTIALRTCDDGETTSVHITNRPS